MKTIKKKLKKIFRSIFYKIFFYKYGRIKFKKTNNKNLVVRSVKINNRFQYPIYECLKSRLYTNRIQDTAIIQNNILLDKPSFQLRDNNFDHNIRKNIVLKIGTPRLLKKLNGNVASLLTGGGGNNNYFHWMFDVLPKIGIFEIFNDIKKINYFLCPNLNSWQLKTLYLLGIKKNQCLSSVNFRHIQANNIITTPHPWLKSKNIIKDMENIPPWINTWLREKFIKKRSNKKFPKKIFIDRSDSNSNSRYIVNEKEVVNFLHSKGFVSIRLADLKFEDEVKLFYDAEMVVGLQGAGLTNLIYGSKNLLLFLVAKK